jgi:hypothetical protein
MPTAQPHFSPEDTKEVIYKELMQLQEEDDVGVLDAAERLRDKLLEASRASVAKDQNCKASKRKSRWSGKPGKPGKSGWATRKGKTEDNKPEARKDAC